jgi:hypothetical protein
MAELFRANRSCLVTKCGPDELGWRAIVAERWLTLGLL